jgi:acyl-CoA synthetase (AMP-forming)/AMP-acid ligase II
MGSNPHSSVEELDRVFELTKPRLIITEEVGLRNVLDVSNRKSIPANRVLLLDETAMSATIALIHGQSLVPAPSKQSPHDFLSLLAYGTSDHEQIPSIEQAKNTPAALYLTSGTTGLPKAAVLSHAALLARHRSIAHTPTPPYAVKRLICLPIFHVFSSLWTHLFPVRYGHPLYILRGFQLPVFLETIRRYQITETYLVPVVIHALNQASASFDVGAALVSLRYVGISGAPIDRASMEVFRGLLHPDAWAGQVWGMTECGVVIQSGFPVSGRGRGEGQDDLGGIGRVLPEWEVKLDTTASDSEGRASSEVFARQSRGEVIEKDGVTGQLYVRGPGLLSGYLGHREPVVDSQGWFNTGDVAYFNSRREYFIVGRTKELIKVQGYVTQFSIPCHSDLSPSLGGPTDRK